MMDLTPLEVRKKKGDFRRQIRGYDPALVDDFLDLVADRLEQLVRDNLALTERTTRLEQQVSEFRERERAMTDALVTAQEMREQAKSLVASEAERARTNAERDADRIRIEAQSAREREEESIRRLVVRKSQFLQAFRTFLQRELAEIDVEDRTVEVDASRSGVRLDRNERRGPGQDALAAAVPATAAALPLEVARTEAGPAAPPRIEPAPPRVEPRVEPAPPRVEPRVEAAPTRVEAAPVEMPQPAPKPARAVEPEPEPEPAELELSEADIEIEEPVRAEAPKPANEMPPPPWSFDDEAAFGQPEAEADAEAEAAPVPSTPEPTALAPQPAPVEPEPEPVAEIEIEIEEDADELSELDAILGGEEKDEAFDFDAALASLAAKVGDTDLGDDLFDDSTDADPLRGSDDAGEILLMDEVGDEDEAVDLLDDLEVDELDIEPPRMGVASSDAEGYDTDDFGAPPAQRQPPPLWDPNDGEPSEVAARSSEDGVKERSRARGSADDDVDDLLANLFGDGA